MPHAADPDAAVAAPAADAAATEIHIYITYYVECVALCGRGSFQDHMDCYWIVSHEVIRNIQWTNISVTVNDVCSRLDLCSC